MNMASHKLSSARKYMPHLLHKDTTRLLFKNDILQHPGLHNCTPSYSYNALSWTRLLAYQSSSVWNKSSVTSPKYVTSLWRNVSTQTPKISKLRAALKLFVKTSLKVIFGSVLLVVGAGGLLIAKIAFIDDDIEPVISEGPPAPKHKSHISKVWLEYILTQYEDKKMSGAKVEVKDFHVNMGMNPGDGYNSTMFKLDVDATIQQPAKHDHISGGAVQEETKMKWDHTYHLMAKTSGAKFEDFILQYAFGMSPKEYEASVSVIPELNSFLEENGYKEFEISTPNIIYAKCNEEEFILVMENLKELGYQTYPKNKFLDLYHAKIAVENLANFHAVSYAYNKTHDFQNKFPSFALNDSMLHMIESMNEQFMDVTISYLKSREDLLYLGNKLGKNKETLLKQYGEMLRENHSNKIMCLNHGDYWGNNFMFKYAQEEGSEREIDNLKIIDLQLMHWNTSVLDLIYMLMFSTRLAFRKEHQEEILQHYHTMFCKATSKMGVLPMNWTYEQFKKEYDRCKIFGFVRGLTILNFAFSESPKELKKDSYVLQETYFEPGPLARKITYKSANLLMNNKTFSNFIMYLFALPIEKELKSGENNLLNNLIIDIVNEADEFGLLDSNHENI